MGEHATLVNAEQFLRAYLDSANPQKYSPLKDTTTSTAFKALLYSYDSAVVPAKLKLETVKCSVSYITRKVMGMFVQLTVKARWCMLPHQALILTNSNSKAPYIWSVRI